MEAGTSQPHTPTAIRTDLAAIFVSLELSRSTWLITSLSPGNGEKMSKHSVAGGDVAALLNRFAQLQEKVRSRTGNQVPIVSIQEDGVFGPSPHLWRWCHEGAALRADGKRGLF